jgi:2-methylcitrate dehydratase PrpD
MGDRVDTTRTLKLVEWIEAISYNSIPQEVISMAKLCLLDTLGCAVFGSTRAWSKMVEAVVRKVSGKGESTIINSHPEVPAPAAALVNGTMVHSFELDDYHLKALLHPGAPVIPAELALGEVVNATGKQILEALVIGYEAITRIGMMVAPEAGLRGYHPTGINGAFGSAIASAKLLGFTGDKILSCLGIAGSQAAGLLTFCEDSSQREGGMVKRFHAGRASEGGLLAALLVAEGFEGPATILEGQFGYGKVYGGKINSECLTKSLGEDYQILHVAQKPYACCGLLHSSIDAILEIKRKRSFSQKEIAGITVGVPKGVIEQHGDRTPQSIGAAQYSLPFAIAVTLCGDIHDPDIFNKKTLTDVSVQEMAKKVNLVPDSDLDQYFPAKGGAKVTLSFRDGSEASWKIYDTKGMPENRLSFVEVATKFKYLCRHALTPVEIEEAIAVVEELEKLDSIRKLMKLFRGSSATYVKVSV